MTRVKICCIQSIDEAILAMRLGADALGFVANMPSGPGIISEKKIRELVALMPPGITTVLLTSETDPEPLSRQIEFIMPNAVQLVMPVTGKTHVVLKKRFPFLKRIQVVHVGREVHLDSVRKISEDADALLLDSRISSGGVTVYGGTGQIHDWDLSRKIVQKADIPVFLAGGLNPSNIQQAIETVHPFAVDVCTGVRTRDILDEKKLSGFIRVAHSL